MATRDGRNNGAAINFSVDYAEVASAVTKSVMESFDNVDQAVATAVKRLGSALKDNLRFDQYFKDIDTLSVKVNDAFSKFSGDKSIGNAEELVKLYNALSARSEEAARSISGSLSNFHDVMADASNLFADAGKYDVGAFKEMFSVFESLKAVGVDVESTFGQIFANTDNVRAMREQIGALEADLSRSNDELDRTRERLSDVSDELFDAQSNGKINEFNELIRTARNEFNAFLIANNIDRSDFRLTDIFEQIEEGALTSGEAITRLKSELPELLPKDASVGIEPFLAKMEEILMRMDEMQTSIRELGTISPQSGISTGAVEGTEAITHESEAVRELVSQSPAVQDFAALLASIIKLGAESGGEASDLNTQVKPLVDTLRSLADVDAGKLQSLGRVFSGLASVNGIKVHPAAMNNLQSGLEGISRIQDTGALKELSTVDFRKFNELKPNKAALENLAMYLPTIASADADNLKRLSEIDFSGFANIKAPDINTDGITSIVKMADAFERAADNVATLNRQISSGAASSSGGGSGYIYGQFSKLIDGVSVKDRGKAIGQLGFTPEDAAELTKYIENMGIPVDKLKTSWEKVKDETGEYRQILVATVSGKNQFGDESVRVLKFSRALEEVNGKMQPIIKDGVPVWDNIESGIDSVNLAMRRMISGDDQIIALNKLQEKITSISSTLNTAASGGLDQSGSESRGNFNALSYQLKQYRELYQKVDEGTVTQKEFDKEFQKLGIISQRVAKEMAPAIKEVEALQKAEEQYYKDLEAQRNADIAEEERKAEEYYAAEEKRSAQEDIMWKQARTKANEEELQSLLKLEDAFDAYEGKQRDALVAEEARQDAAGKKESDRYYDELDTAAAKSQKAQEELAWAIHDREEKEREAAEAGIKHQEEYIRKTREAAQATAEAEDASGEKAAHTYWDELDKEADKVTGTLDKLQQSITDSGEAIRGPWGEATEEQKNNLTGLSEGVDRLKQSYAEGKIGLDEYTESAGNLKEEYNNLDAAVTRQYDAAKKVGAEERKLTKETLDSLNARRSANNEIRNATRILNEYSAAEHSRNQSSREAYQNIDRYRGELQNLNAQYSSGKMSLEEYNQKWREYSGEISRNAAIIELNGDAHMTAFGKIGRAIKTHLTTLSATAAIGTVMREIRQMVEAVKEIDTAMTELRKVTDETDARYEKFLTDAATRAKALSATISDTVSATADFARLGLSIDEAEAAADAAIVYKSVGDNIESIGDAAESIISTMKAFGIEATDAMSIVDKFNLVGNKFAIGSGGLGEALKRSASAMYAANNTLEETIGLATAANTILQNPQSVGTTLKTVSMYVRAAKTELEAAGEETEGIAESTGKLRELIMAITREGGKAVDIMADENRFKSTYQILEEISEVWDKISDTNQAALLEKLGGKRNANAIAAILENFDIARDAMEVASNAEGSAMAELEKYQESIEGHMVALKTAFQELSSAVVDSDLVKTVIDIGRYLLEFLTGVTKVIERLGGLRTILTAVAGISIAKLVSQIGSLNTNLTAAAKVAGSFRNAFSFLLKGGASEIINGLKGIAGAIAGPQGIIAGVTVLLTVTSALYTNYKRTQAEYAKTLVDTGKDAIANSQELSSLYDKYAELSNQVDIDAESKSELADVTDKLLERLGIEKETVSKLGDEYSALSDNIKSVTLAQLNEKVTDIEGAISGAGEQLMALRGFQGAFEFISGFDFAKVYAKAESSQREQIIQTLRDAGLGGVKAASNGKIEIDFGNLGSPDEIVAAYDEIKSAMQALTSAGYGAGTPIFDELTKRAVRIESAVKQYRELIEARSDVYADINNLSGRNEPSFFDDAEALSAHRDALEDQVTALRDYIDAFDDYIAVEQEAQDAGYTDISETVFGNIDTNNRQILDWTKETIEKYRDVLEEWGYSQEDIREMLGSISTVMGTSSEYEGLEIAFSPILQTEDGPVLLSPETVDRYIFGLFDELSGLDSWTDEDILRLDTRGLEVDGMLVKNLLAGIGDDAIRVGEAMHYAGTDGALSESFVELRTAASKANVPMAKFRDTIDGWRNKLSDAEDEIRATNERLAELGVTVSTLNDTGSAISAVSQTIAAYKDKVSVLNNAWVEFRENGRITSETYQRLNTEFENESGLVEIVNGKLSLNADAVEKLNEKLRDEYGLKIALAGASEEEIARVDNLASSLRNLSASVEDPTASLKELTGVLTQMHEGYELSTFDTLNLIQKYPQLRDKIISTAKGYQIEEAAIRELISAKSQLLTLNEREIGVSSAREALVSKAGSDTAATKIEKIFSDFETKNGRRITSIEDFASGYLDEFGRTYEGVYEQYDRYVNALIDVNNGLEVDANILSQLLNDVNTEVKEGYDPTKESKSSSSTKKEETEFEKAYKLHQHYVAMNQETEEQYLAWLDGAYKASYAAGEMELDDYYKYEEEVYEKRKQLFQTSLDEMQHQIDLLSHQLGDTSQEQIAIYEQMQKKVNAQANAYRARGIKENDELIRELQNQWWQYEDSIRQLRESAFNDWLSDRKFVIDQLKQDSASTNEIVNSWREVLTKINDEIAYYLSKGYDITSDVIQNLMNELKEAKDSILEALDDVVSKANEVVDGFENVYQTLASAGKEYASTGYLSVDSLQSILSLGPQYMDMLYDEAGQLTINENALQKIIAARTEEMAAETALSYAKQVLLATENDETQTLRELSGIQAAAASNTWDVAYATLGYAKAIGATKGISADYYDKAYENITKMQSLTKTAVDSIGAYYETLQDGYISQADALDQILKLTEDMIKQENSDRIDDLEKEKDLYKDIIDEKKEILRLTKEQNDHDRDMADKLKEISDLQSKIDQLALDDSREARAQRTKLEADLLEKQKSLTDSQNDYAYDAQVDALDKQYDAFEEEKDDEIDGLKKELSSAEKLYQAAVNRITDAWENDWEGLKNQLISWNFEVGNTLEKDLTAAWDAATAAAERYGNFVNALDESKNYNNLGNRSVTTETPSARTAYDGGAAVVSGYIDRMRANSKAWFTAENPGAYAAENQKIAAEYKAATGQSLSYDSRKGLWYKSGSSTPLYTLTDQEVGEAITAAMKANSEAWKTASQSDQRKLAEKNEDLAKKLAAFTGKPVTKTQAGVWMYNGIPLYDVRKFHTGGIVGGAKSLRQSEVMALLQKGEAVLDERRETALYKTVDFVQMLSDKIGHAIDKGRLSSLLSGTGASFAASAVPALAGGGIGTMNFSPTIQITFANTGDMNESQARKYGNIAAESALQQLKAAFSQRGVGALGNSTLK